MSFDDTDILPNGSPTATGYTTLPENPEAARAAVQAHIDLWRAGVFPNAVVALTEYVNAVGEHASPEVVEQRALMADLGLNPDVFMPLPEDVKNVAAFVQMMRFPEDSARAWLTAAGFVGRDVENIIGDLVFIPQDILDYVDTLDDTPVEHDDRITKIITSP